MRFTAVTVQCEALGESLPWPEHDFSQKSKATQKRALRSYSSLQIDQTLGTLKHGKRDSEIGDEH